MVTLSLTVVTLRQTVVLPEMVVLPELVFLPEMVVLKVGLTGQMWKSQQS